MKPRKAQDLRDLSSEELVDLLQETQETLAKQNFQHALKQLNDSAYLRILKRDVARIRTILNEKES